MSEVAAVKTPFSPRQLVDALRAAWAPQLGGVANDAAIAILCAQIALETANGTACICNNLGNWKRTDPSAGDYCSFSTFEYDGAGRRHDIHPPDPGCRFAAFPDLTIAASKYLHGMYTRWATAWSAACQGDAPRFVLALHTAGYFTAPPQAYANGVERWQTYYAAVIAGDPGAPLPPTTPSLDAEVALFDLNAVDPDADTEPPGAA